MKIVTQEGTELSLSPVELSKLVDLGLATVDIDLTEIEDYKIDCEDCSFSGCCDITEDEEVEVLTKDINVILSSGKTLTVRELFLFLLNFDDSLQVRVYKDLDGFYIIDTCLDDDMKDRG